MSEAEHAANIARTPLQRIVQPEDQARVLCSLASADVAWKPWSALSRRAL